MTEGCEPFYFTAGDRSLFGLYHPPKGAQRREAVLICYPAPQEMMRSYQTHVQLARELASAGHAVLRFDYSGTGDSDGSSDSLALDRWLVDTLAAAVVLKKKSQISRITLLGTRLGGTMALRASCELGAKQLILWDPVVDGPAYLAALKRSHEAMLRWDPTQPPHPGRRYQAAQCWGFPLSSHLQSELTAITPDSIRTFSKQVELLLSEAGALPEDFPARLRAASGPELSVREQHLNEPMHWLDERYVKRRAFPSQHLRLIKSILEGA